MDQDNSLEQLYNDFRQSLLNGNEPYADEQDLIDIYDFAGDVNDDFVRLEVLTLGQRLYPDSLQLRKRHAIMLADINQDSFVDYVKANRHDSESDDLTWAILKCKATRPTGEDAVKALNGIIGKYRLDEDEDTIQFVNLVGYLGVPEWLIDNLETLKSRAAYTPTLIYEIAQVLQTNGFRTKAIELMEEMTMQEPFNLNYWIFLTELQTMEGMYDEAMGSLEYAKAIDSTTAALLSVEGYILLSKGDYAGAVDILREAHNQMPDDIPTQRNLVESLRLSGHGDEAVPLLEKLVKEEPADKNLFMSLASVTATPLSPEIIRRYVISSATDEAGILQLVYEFYHNGFKPQALDIIKWYADNVAVSKPIRIALIEMLYANGEYAETLSRFNEGNKPFELEPNETYILPLVISSLLRLGLYDSALDYCIQWLPQIRIASDMSLQVKMLLRGTISQMKSYLMLLKRKSAPTAADIDEAEGRPVI